ncbi:hypothetical protein N0O92_05275 [Alkalihalobacillus sp. MEB130]|nr:hypothetical protein [Alkalihalobacillus sp. MEB130]MDT8859638.1 hypothetical protein [Alkalihalobacillus sp. MEB130]
MDESLRSKILFAVVLLLFISFTTGIFTGNGVETEGPQSPLLLFD